MLRAPVDLLWNGGIGTYVKASSESHADVGDRTNDAVRADGRELRAKVVGEGGNLGLTQRGRIEYATHGGRINTDAIDNSGGVDCSDHEVNLKILLGLAVEAGELTVEERNEVLQSVAGDVVAHVLYDNYLQVQILSQETAVAAQRMEAYEDLMVELEARGLLERTLEFLPTTEQMAERRAAGAGLVRPELCVLLAYAKRLLREHVLASAFPDDPYLDASLRRVLPARRSSSGSGTSWPRTPCGARSSPPSSPTTSSTRWASPSSRAWSPRPARVPRRWPARSSSPAT